MTPIILNHFGRKTALIQMLNERGAELGVEIGTDHGQYARNLLDGIPNLVLFCVDPWVAYKEGEIDHSQEEVDQIYEQAKNRLKGLKGLILKTTSINAIRKFEDNSLDFVFIDGNHDFEHVFEDVTEWTKKVKPGGIVCGHDYIENKECNYGVIEAVNKYVEDNHIAPFFILHAGGKLVDCWMFIKQ